MGIWAQWVSSGISVKTASAQSLSVLVSPQREQEYLAVPCVPSVEGVRISTQLQAWPRAGAASVFTAPQTLQEYCASPASRQVGACKAVCSQA